MKGGTSHSEQPAAAAVRWFWSAQSVSRPNAGEDGRGTSHFSHSEEDFQTCPEK